MSGKLALLAVVVIVLGVLHRGRRRRQAEVSTGSKPIEAVGTQVVG